MRKLMGKVIQYVRELYQIISFCIRLSVKSSPKYFFLSILINLFLVLLPFGQIYATSQIINLLASAISSGFQAAAANSFIIYICLLLLLSVGLKALSTLKNHCDGLHREIMQKHIKQLNLQKMNELDLSYFDSSSFYNEMQDAASNSPLIMQTAFVAVDLLRYLIQLVIAVACLAPYNLFLVILLLASIVPNVVYQKKQLDALYDIQRSNLENERKMYYAAGLMSSRDFAKDIRLYNLYPFLSAKFQNAWDLLFDKKKKTSGRYTKLLVICSIFPELMLLSIVFLLGWGVLHGTNTMGDFSYYQGVANQVLGGMYMMVVSYGQLMDGKMRLQNFLKFMDWKSKVKNEGKLPYTGAEFNLEFRHVSFRYAEHLPYVLKDVSFRIRSGSKVAFVGGNGSGKTTAIKLMMRYYDPSEGEILLNGIDLREYELDSLRRGFSTLFQDYCKYAFTVWESVSLSDYVNMGDEEKVRESLQKSGADSFVSRFPGGLNTYLTRQYDEHGEELSGGQWQKVASSRTFFREAPMYVLDEPSAALDAEAEDALFQQFKAFYQNKTAVLVSHRLSNISSVDWILVLEEGQLVEEGSHAELMRRNGRYAYLYRLQAEKYEAV